jgi:quercetin dioxygenase-like cupin family protein
MDLLGLGTASLPQARGPDRRYDAASSFCKELRMPVERAADHPTFEIGGNAVTSFAAPARGAEEAALFQIELPAGGGLPPHRHDHFDVFTVTAGGGTVFLGDEASTLAAGDSCVVPPDQLHWVEAGPDGATIVVTMLAGTKLIREDDGTVLVPPWVS